MSKSGVLYDFETHDPSTYLSDYQRFIRSSRINGHWNALIDNKLAFHRVLGEFPSHRPSVYGLLRGGDFHLFDPDDRAVASDGGSEFESQNQPALDASQPTMDPLEWFDATLSNGDQLVLKWFSGGGGNNVHFLEQRDGSYLYDGTAKTDAELADVLGSLEDYLVCEFVEQADYADELFSDTTNTVRVLTMYDEQAREPFIPIAIHRIGSSDSAPVDNFSNGGLSAEVDRETGQLSAGAEYPYDGTVDWHETHPETGARIEGTAIPGWKAIRERLLEVAGTLSHLSYVGWDLVVTSTGEFKIIEANSYPGVASLQVHRPLLAESRTRRFYRRHHVV
ncbi:sugar-transfer associated ATP-grasp domain-containing protein [Halostagnicola sp. A56]|uniref:sugar-transfer associated ATP-grasp domain-containing protein n=1 Tax=Halostagnicola sp. A56 TaxID=1495067 RepID=UPI001E2D8C21|nr:sugar-transfer associated ATP-grasp domain-containing protein [Halostagnicola sp. A56]